MNLTSIPDLTDFNMDFYSDLLETIPQEVEGYLVYKSKTQSVKTKIRKYDYKPPIVNYN
jgi:hypothetical protein